MNLPDFIKAYLSFSARDRAGILVLAAILLAVILLPAVWTDSHPPLADPAETAEFLRVAKSLRRPADSGSTAREEPRNPGDDTHTFAAASDRLTVKPVRLFDFDPNTLSPEKWLELGVRQRTVSTIMHYLAKGGRFRRPEDLEKIYGLSPDQVQALIAHVKIAAPPARPPFTPADLTPGTGRTITNGYGNAKSLAPVDINAADSLAWMAIPGIGSRLAARILAFRARLGGFCSVNQVGETYGIPDSVFARMLPQLRCRPGVQRRINLNTADVATLKAHPYIRWSLANAIVRYRDQHGLFATVDALLGIDLVTPDLLEKLAPYLVIE